MVKGVYEIFGVEKPLIGMIHLAGRDLDERVKRGLSEIELLEEVGFNGVIIEDFHGTPDDVYECLAESSKRGFNIVRGINILRKQYASLEWADKFGARFVQFDSVLSNTLQVERYNLERSTYPSIAVLGGARFKYQPSTEKSLEEDLEEAMERCDVIVTTGDGTGIETPLDKLKSFREVLGDFPLVVGAGVNRYNIKDQMEICDGAIIGSALKPNSNTRAGIKKEYAEDLINRI